MGIHKGGNTWSKGRKLSEDHKKKLSDFQKTHPNKGRFKKGNIISEETRRKIALAHLGKKLSESHIKRMNESRKIGKDSHRWIGDKVKYMGLHMWVRKELGSPHDCEHCGNTDLNHRQYHWANKSGEYKRDVTDWIRLCVKCHKKYDTNN